MRKLLLGLTAVVFLAPEIAGAASVSRTYSYFSIGGSTLDEIQGELTRRGPRVASTGRRHPGATALTFTSRFSFEQSPGSCRIVKADVTVGAKVTLPRWKRPQAADAGTKLIWDTLAADIKRHEEIDQPATPSFF